jgi:hypothetical protein
MVASDALIDDQPAYRAGEAARILALPVGTVNAWCFGHDHRHRDGTPKRFRHVIEPAQPGTRERSFVNLCELHLLGVICRRHGVKRVKARQAIDFLQRGMGVSRPLATQNFRCTPRPLRPRHPRRQMDRRSGPPGLGGAHPRPGDPPSPE